MSKKILIIDDNQDDAKMLKGVLKDEGFKVYVSNNGYDGLNEARKLKPDLVLLDLILPDIDGFDVCEEIRKDESLVHTKIIIISVKSDVEKVGKVLRVKADDYVVKALVEKIPDDLIEKVRILLNIKK